MKLIVFAAVLMVAAAQEYFEASPYVQDLSFHPDSDIEHVFPSEEELVPHFGIHPRFRRGVSMDPKTGDVTADHKMDNSRIFGTVGSNDAGLFGKGGYERNIFNDHRGALNAQAYGSRTLGAGGDSSALGGALNWKNDRAAASLDLSKQIHGPTSWNAAAGGRWPVGKNGEFGFDGTYGRVGGASNYGGMATYNQRW